MPLYEDEINSREKLWELRKRNQCQQCGGMLNIFMDFARGKAFLACNDWPQTHHEGIAREALEYNLNIPTRREDLAEELGEEKTKALDKYIGVVSLTRPQAREILKSIWPAAPDAEVARAVMLCAGYQLNPLMKHVFLIKFNRWNKAHTQIIGEDWSTVIGIKAKRLLASRRGSYSYIDNTPRVMTEDEQITIFGEVEADKLWIITKGKDPQTGAEAVGYGFWPKDEKPYGTEKGNTKFNMGAIRSESQMLDRLRPGEMPVGVEVVDEQYGAPPILISMSEGREKIGEQPPRGGEEEPEPSATILSLPKTGAANPQKIEVPAAEPEQETFSIDPQWLKEILAEIHWSEDTARSWLITHFHLKEVKGTLQDILSTLTIEQVEEFISHLRNRVAQKQMGLF